MTRRRPPADAASAPAEPPFHPPQHNGPVAYDPLYCDWVVESMGKGYSLTAFAGEIGVARATVGEWIKAWPDFAAAVERARAARVRALEGEFLTAGTGAKVAAQVFALRNAAPEDWRDRPAAAEGAADERVVIAVPDNGREDG